MSEQKTIIDVDEAEKISLVILRLVNEYPGLDNGKILFSTLNETSGIGFFPSSGSVLETNREDVTGHFWQMCQYPFTIVYRASPKSEKQRGLIKEFLDGLGRWLERQPVIIDETSYQLQRYPAMELGNRFIKSISRTSPGHLQTAYTDGIEDWAITASMRYENEFDT